MSVSIGGTTGVTFPDASVQNTAATGFGFKSRIINGAMMIDQRNAGASVTPSSATYSLDRWNSQVGNASAFSLQQSSTAASGFIKSLLVTSLAATSVGSTNSNTIEQYVEGLNCADLGWGAAGAASITISFWVRSSLTGAFGGCIQNSDNTRSYVFSYTISAANTWEQKTVTIAGDTSGTWLTTNGIGIKLRFSLGNGSTLQTTAGSWASANYRTVTSETQVLATNGATFYITGVQLEKGSTATSFDYRPYPTELALCQRYCPVFNMGSSGTGDGYRGFAANTTLSDYSLALLVTPRVPPTGITASGTFGVGNGAAGANATSIAFLSGGNSSLGIRATTTAGSPTLSQGVGTSFYGSTNGLIIATGCEL